MPELRAGPQQPRVDERRPVVDVDRVRDAAGGQRRAQRRGQADGVLGEPEPVPDRPPGSDRRGTRTDTSCGRRPSGRAGRRRSTARWARSASNRPNTAGVAPAARAGQLERGGSGAAGCVPTAPSPTGARRIRRDLRGGAGRVLPLQRRRQLQHLGRGARRRPGAGAGTSASNPPARQRRIHRSSVSRDTRTGRPNGSVCSRAAIARTSRPRCLRRQRRVGRLPDQLVAEQPDLPGPAPARPGHLVMRLTRHIAGPPRLLVVLTDIGQTATTTTAVTIAASVRVQLVLISLGRPERPARRQQPAAGDRDRATRQADTVADRQPRPRAPPRRQPPRSPRPHPPTPTRPAQAAPDPASASPAPPR